MSVWRDGDVESWNHWIAYVTRARETQQASRMLHEEMVLYDAEQRALMS